jgi:hypothetical protein
MLLCLAYQPIDGINCAEAEKESKLLTINAQDGIQTYSA